MKLFAGLSRTDYEDLFRAVGALIDERGWSNVSLMEVEEGLIVQVMVKPSLRQTRPQLETYLLTDTDLERVQRDAIRRRQQREAPKPAPHAPTFTPPEALPDEPVTPTSPARNHAGRGVEGRLASLMSQGRGAQQPAPAQDDPLPPMPTLEGLQSERELNSDDEYDIGQLFAQVENGHRETEAPVFAPEPLRLAPEPAAPPPAYDAGAARAAVVMAHIVAARIKSGVPLTGDDPDLASLLEQVRALDDAGIGKG